MLTDRSTRFKSKFNFLTPNPNNHNAILDAIKVNFEWKRIDIFFKRNPILFDKVTDTCIFVVSAKNGGIDASGNRLFDMIYSFHLPTSLFVVQVNLNLDIA